MSIARRTLLIGAAGAALSVGRLAHGAKPTILIFTSDDSDRSKAIVTAFKERAEFAVRISYDLGGQPDAGAFIADNIRGMPASLVFAVGDLALKTAAREFADIPLVYTDVKDTAPAQGRDDVVGVSTQVDPTLVVERLVTLLPSMRTLGVIRGASDDSPYWKELEAAAEARGVRLAETRVASSADVQNAVATHVHTSDMLLLRGDDRIWTGATVASALRQAYEGKLPVVSWRREHLSASPPAPAVVTGDASAEGAAAAALAERLISTTASADRAYPPPIIVASLFALRAVDVKVTKKTSAAVDEWIDR